MGFNLAEKLAVVKMIDTVIIIDEVVHPQEITAFSKLMTTIDFDSNLIVNARNMETKQGLAILNDMTDAKKEALATILYDMAMADGFLHEKEKDLLFNTFSAIGVE